MKCQILMCLNSPTLTFSTISNLEHRRFARSTTHLELVIFSHIQLLSSWTKKLCNLEKWYNYLSQAFNREDSQQMTSKNSMLLCQEARRRAWRVTTDIARFQLFRGFDEWTLNIQEFCVFCTYFQQTFSRQVSTNQPTCTKSHLQPGRFGLLLIWRAKGLLFPMLEASVFRSNAEIAIWSGGEVVEASGKLSCLIFFLPHFFLQFKKKWESKQKKGCFAKKTLPTKTLSKQHLFSSTSVLFWCFFLGWTRIFANAKA